MLTQLESLFSQNAGWKCNECGLRMRGKETGGPLRILVVALDFLAAVWVTWLLIEFFWLIPALVLTAVRSSTAVVVLNYAFAGALAVAFFALLASSVRRLSMPAPATSGPSGDAKPTGKEEAEQLPEDFLAQLSSKSGQSSHSARTCPHCASASLTAVKSPFSRNVGWTCNACGMRMRHSQDTGQHVVEIIIALVFLAGLGLLVARPLFNGSLSLSDISWGEPRSLYTFVMLSLAAILVPALLLSILIRNIRRVRMPPPEVSERSDKPSGELSPSNSATSTEEPPATDSGESPDDFLRHLSENQ